MRLREIILPKRWMRMTGILALFLGASACGTMEKDSGRTRYSSRCVATVVEDMEAHCEADPSPVITDIRINPEDLCSDGVAHVIVEAADKNNERLEYRLMAKDIDVEQDYEFQNAFIISGFHANKRVSMNVLAGDGCTVAMVAVSIDGPQICTCRQEAPGRFQPNGTFLTSRHYSDDAYISTLLTRR